MLKASEIVMVAKIEIQKRSPGIIPAKYVAELNTILDDYLPDAPDPDDVVALVVCMAIEISVLRRKK